MYEDRDLKDVEFTSGSGWVEFGMYEDRDLKDVEFTSGSGWVGFGMYEDRVWRGPRLNMQ